MDILISMRRLCLLTALATGLVFGQSLARPVSGDVLDIVAQSRQRGTPSPWPGFQMGAIPVAIYDGESTFLCGHPTAVDGFRRLAGAPDIQVRAARHDALRANTAILLNGVWTGSFIATDLDARPADDWIRLIVHECFHAYQNGQDEPWPMANEVALLQYPFDDREALALRRMELRALREALAASNRDEQTRAVSSFVRARAARTDLVPAAAMQYERDLERYEGIAEYVGLAAVGGPPQPPPPGGFPAEQLRWRCYFTGPAMAQLLDQLDPPWKETFNPRDGRALDLLLAELCPGPEPGQAMTIDPVLLAAAQREVDELVDARRRTKREYTATPGWTVSLIARDGEPIWPQGFDPLNLRSLGSGEVLHTRWLQAGNGDLDLELLDHAGLTVGTGENPMFDGISRIVVAGLPGRPDVERHAGTVRIVAGELLTLACRGTLTIDPKAELITIRLAGD